MKLWRVLAAAVTVTVAWTTRNAALGAAVGVAMLIAPHWVTLADNPPTFVRGRWWSHTELVRALTAAGVLAKPKAGDKPPVLHYRGRPQTDQAGTAVTVELPAGLSHSVVAARRDQLAAALKVPAARLVVEQHPDNPANVTRLWVGTGNVAGRHVDYNRLTDWRRLIRCGVDKRGRAVDLATHEANFLIAGIPGTGNTPLARLVLGHYLMDPAAVVYVFDGKGSRDYLAARELCAGFVLGTAETVTEDTLAMLDEVLASVRRCNATGGIVGTLVVLEEWQDLRSAVDVKTRDRLDNLLGRIVRMGRAVGVSVLVSTQRPSVDDLPSGVRNLISQRVALQLRNGQDAALVLGHTPTAPLPRRRGQAILVTPAREVAVTLDHLDAEAWAAACERAARLRPAAEPVTLPLAAAAPIGSLLGAVVDTLADHPGGLSASDLLDRLPEPLRPGSPDALGRHLGRHPAQVVRAAAKGTNGQVTRVWRLPA